MKRHGAWGRLDEFGRRAHQPFWKTALERFVYTRNLLRRRHGYFVPEIIHDFYRCIWHPRAKLKQTGGSAACLSAQWQAAWPWANKFSNPAFPRKALRLLADRGPREFYEGEIAKAILKTSNALGGTMGPGDLAEFSSEWVEPISIDYRGWRRVCELPPNGQGMAALEMLNIMAASQPAAKTVLRRSGRATQEDRSDEARLHRSVSLQRRSLSVSARIWYPACFQNSMPRSVPP